MNEEIEKLAIQAGLPTGEAWGYRDQLQEFAHLVEEAERQVIVGILESELPSEAKAANWTPEMHMRHEVVSRIIEDIQTGWHA